LLYWAVTAQYGDGVFSDEVITKPILEFCYDWAAKKFLELMRSTVDPQFLYFLFSNHEDSIHIYYQTAEPDFDKEDISISLLSLNRRILKLALEQVCDIEYGPDLGLNSSKLNHFISLLEDLLYVGDRLYAYSEYMAEQRMMENPTQIIVGEGDVLIQRQHHYDHIYHVTEKFNNEGYEKGIVDNMLVKELRQQLLICFGIDYDKAGGQIFVIKKHHSSHLYQTIQRDVLIENLIRSGVSEEHANNFYGGLTISRENKLEIKASVYQSGSFYRYMFRPILIVSINGEMRALIGEEKWQESIFVMATNGFQWQHGPEEWKQNDCFKKFLERKHDEHDKLLEDQAQAIFEKKDFYFDRKVMKLLGENGLVVDINDQPGEIDFIFFDHDCKKILVTDCKYHRARYEMVGFSNDYVQFTRHYEKKMKRKIQFIKNKLELLKTHMVKQKGLPIDFDIKAYSVEGLFIVNTPTFYIFNGIFPTITIGHLEEFIEYCYKFGDLVLKYPTHNKIIKHPWFTVQEEQDAFRLHKSVTADLLVANTSIFGKQRNQLSNIGGRWISFYFCRQNIKIYSCF